MHWLGGQNDMSGQSNYSLRMCNVKISKCLSEHKQGTFPRMHGLQPVASSNVIFFKMLTLDEKEFLYPKSVILSDLVNFQNYHV